MTVLDAARQQLAALEQQLEDSNPQLYRHLALYLQVLRDGLLNSVQQACFHLATQAYPDRYCELEAAGRQLLHRRLVGLVQRATSLLTVEHLAHLASQMAREQQRQSRQRRSRLLNALEQGHLDPSEPQGSRLGPAPRGSVHLGLALPIGGDFLPTSSVPLPSFGLGSALNQPEPEPESDPELEAQDGAPLEAAEDTDPDPNTDTDPDPNTDTDSDTDPDTDGSEDRDRALQLMAEVFSAWREPLPSQAPTPWDGGVLPTSPVLLMAWLAGFEQALCRRLRNLSHALNVDLMRLGLSRTLLPVSLLDAVLAGQLDSLEAPANLLRLPLPLGPEPGGKGMEALVLLLRTADLELEQPKLRTCRTRIQQHRQEVRRMAEHYRRLQRRVQALEAEQLWLQDITPAQSPLQAPT